MKTKVKLSSKRAASTRSNHRRSGLPKAQLKLPGSLRSPSSPIQIKSILVPIDFSPASEKALAYAVPLAKLFGARLTLLHVLEPVATPDFAAFPLAMENDKAMRASRLQLERVASDLKLRSLAEKFLVRNGRAFNEITSAARTLKSDLVVISTHGRTGLKHVLMGSTAEKVVQHAPCPVLVVRPKEREFVKSKV
jgi:nucleotide-binding universal stress UspA family protein